mmetsp:Transcript_21125/g.23518  ORF Transcript_21125/g.23518 Transcript_21125/m.23518 type:complete len:97 (+) Transcript_21125:2-292(+)
MFRGYRHGHNAFRNMGGSSKGNFRSFYYQQRMKMSYIKMEKMSLISGPQLQAAKLAALSNLNIGMVNSITIEGIDLSEELSEEFDIEEDDGRCSLN